MSRNQLWVLSGAAVMAFGTFLPVISIPLAGNLNYFQNGQGDGVFVIVLAAATAVMALTKALKFSWIPSALAGGLVVYSLLSLISTVSNALADLQSSLEGNPFAGLAQGLFGSVQIQWGWVVMLAGSCIAIYGSLAKFKILSNQIKEDDEHHA